VVRKNGVLRANAGIPDKVVVLVFPGTNVRGSTDAADWNKRIHDAGHAALTQWGGLQRLQTCAK
jgi:hypothetical protein